MAPGPTLSIAITLSLEGDSLVQAAHALSLPVTLPASPRPSLSSLHWEQVRPWALAPAMRCARARNTPNSHESFEALSLHAPTLILTPSLVPGIPAP